jgi:tRNA-dihydrouridine synthase
MNLNLTYYVAPLEGVTTYIYRNAHREFFPDVETYFSPFVIPKDKNPLAGREERDILPANNTTLHLVPQILTNNADGFLRATAGLAELGYSSVNLNLGCPSGTVFSKGRGSGFLAHQPELEAFLEEVFARSVLPVSVKTRIGVDHEEEWEELMPIFNRYPMKELIIHPRLRSDFYKNTPHMDVFRDAVAESKNPIVYNGDLFTVADEEKFAAQFPQIKTVMLGRGLVANPSLIGQCQGKPMMSKETLWKFHQRLIEDYGQILSGDRPLLFKMKELWSYMLCMFQGAEKCAKILRKSQRLSDYQSAVENLFAQCPLSQDGCYRRL